MFLSMLITCLLGNALILKGEILPWFIMGVKLRVLSLYPMTKFKSLSSFLFHISRWLSTTNAPTLLILLHLTMNAWHNWTGCSVWHESRSNFRIPRNSFTCHWIRIASIVLCLDLQSLPTHVSEADQSCGVFWSLAWVTNEPNGWSSRMQSLRAWGSNTLVKLRFPSLYHCCAKCTTSFSKHCAQLCVW